MKRGANGSSTSVQKRVHARPDWLIGHGTTRRFARALSALTIGAWLRVRVRVRVRALCQGSLRTHDRRLHGKEDEGSVRVRVRVSVRVSGACMVRRTKAVVRLVRKGGCGPAW